MTKKLPLNLIFAAFLSLPFYSQANIYSSVQGASTTARIWLRNIVQNVEWARVCGNANQCVAFVGKNGNNFSNGLRADVVQTVQNAIRNNTKTFRDLHRNSNDSLFKNSTIITSVYNLQSAGTLSGASHAAMGIRASGDKIFTEIIVMGPRQSMKNSAGAFESQLKEIMAIANQEARAYNGVSFAVGRPQIERYIVSRPRNISQASNGDVIAMRISQEIGVSQSIIANDAVLAPATLYPNIVSNVFRDFMGSSVR